MQKKILKFLKVVLEKVDNPFFPLVMAILAAIDHFIIVIPSDGILITSVFIRKKKWVRNAFFISLGSTLGAILIVLIVHHFGQERIIMHFPNITHSTFWPYSQNLLINYGLWGLFLVMLTPFMQQPALILIGLTEHSFLIVLAVVLAGKGMKYFLMAWVASKFPEVIRKSKLLGHEVNEVLELMEDKSDFELANKKLHKDEKKGEKPILP